MTNLHNDDDRNLVNFLRKNCPHAPNSPNNLILEQKLMESISQESCREPHHHLHLIWAIPGAIITGFFLTSINLNLKPQVAIKSDELEKFLVDNWHDTLGTNSVVVSQEQDDWLLPMVTQPQQQQTLSLSSP